MERLPCDPDRECKLRETIGCFEDVHHKQWPRRAYRSIIEKAFRELEENKVRICRDEHNERHATESPPDMPSHQYMRQRVAAAALGASGVELGKTA